MNKRDLSERDICTKFITPALRQAGWFVPVQRTQLPPPITEVLSIIDHCLESGEELISADVGSPLRLRDARWLLERASDADGS
jgi:hypothetical protein